MKFNYLYRKSFLNYILLPFSWLYRIGFWIVKKWPRKKIILPVPLIVVGNLTVGGNGKTPLIIALTNYLQTKNYRVGILTRGYRGSNRNTILAKPSSHVNLIGDEALVLAQNCNVPIIVSPQREHGIQKLINLGCNLILSDDGLQRAKLPRTLEIVVMDDLRNFSNGFCLPAGPLRELPRRLKTVDLVITNLNHQTKINRQIQYKMYLKPLYFQNLRTGKKINIENFPKQKFLAIAAIGNPEKFFATLESLNFIFTKLALPDHDIIYPEKLPKIADIIVVTEKDSVKLANKNISDNWWFLKVETIVDQEFLKALEDKIISAKNKENYNK